MNYATTSSVTPELEHSRLTVILHADVHGYSRLIERDDEATRRLLTPALHPRRTAVRRHGGRIAQEQSVALPHTA